MTYSSRMALISRGVGSLLPLPVTVLSCISSRIMSLQSSTHSSHTNTEGPAMSFLTSCWLLPQKEQYSNYLPSSPEPCLLSHMTLPRSSQPVSVTSECSFRPHSASPILFRRLSQSPARRRRVLHVF